MNFKDPDGLLHLDPLPSDYPENAIVFTVTNWLLTGDQNMEMQKKLIESFIDNGYMFDRPKRNRGGIIASHDNMTAIITMCFLLGVDVKNLKIWPQYQHPRDIIYMGLLQEKWWASYAQLLLLPIFLYMAVRKYKYRHTGKWWKLSSWSRARKTDTEILFWIRTNLPKQFLFLRLCKWIVTPILQLKYWDKKWIRSAINIYYKNPNHPNKVIVNEWT